MPLIWQPQSGPTAEVKDDPWKDQWERNYSSQFRSTWIHESIQEHIKTWTNVAKKEDSTECQTTLSHFKYEERVRFEILSLKEREELSSITSKITYGWRKGVMFSWVDKIFRSCYGARPNELVLEGETVLQHSEVKRAREGLNMFNSVVGMYRISIRYPVSAGYLTIRYYPDPVT